MSIYFCDGSNQGMGIGYGVIRLKTGGFMESYYGSDVHPEATSMMAEIMAIEKCLELAIEKDEKFVVIYCDDETIIGTLEHELDINKGNKQISFKRSTSNTAYTKLRNKVRKYYIEYDINRIHFVKTSDQNENHITYHNSAHAMSRKYMNEIEPIFLEESLILRKNSTSAKKKINDIMYEKTENVEEDLNVTVQSDSELKVHDEKELLPTKPSEQNDASIQVEKEEVSMEQLNNYQNEISDLKKIESEKESELLKVSAQRVNKGSSGKWSISVIKDEEVQESKTNKKLLETCYDMIAKAKENEKNKEIKIQCEEEVKKILEGIMNQKGVSGKRKKKAKFLLEMIKEE